MAETLIIDTDEPKIVAIIGGGLAGSLLAVLMAKRGHNVHLFESRPDLRNAVAGEGRSINMALSTRGRTALRLVDLEEEVLAKAIPMNARMIHREDGSQMPIPYGTKGQFILSVDRLALNQILIQAASEHKNVTLYFEHRLINGNLRGNKPSLMFLKGSEKSAVHFDCDIVFGCDGALSRTRVLASEASPINIKQNYIDHGYIELSIPPSSSGDVKMKKNFLHIWPRHEFMLIALPNPDHSFTVTLIMPFSKFNSLKTAENILTFFQTYFPDALAAMEEEILVKTMMNVRPSTVVSIETDPHHYNNCLILGDAAHAMVPFYGQGMNCAFEDVVILNECFVDENNNNNKIKNDTDFFAHIFEKYSQRRVDDTHAICELAMYNYIEMRALVTSPLFRLRKKIDNILYYLMPEVWVPLYTSVSFSRMSYRQCIRNRKWQDRVLNCVGIGVLGVAGFFTAKMFKKHIEEEVFHMMIERVKEKIGL